MFPTRSTDTVQPASVHHVTKRSRISLSASLRATRRRPPALPGPMSPERMTVDQKRGGSMTMVSSVDMVASSRRAPVLPCRERRCQPGAALCALRRRSGGSYEGQNEERGDGEGGAQRVGRAQAARLKERGAQERTERRAEIARGGETAHDHAAHVHGRSVSCPDDEGRLRESLPQRDQHHAHDDQAYPPA